VPPIAGGHTRLDRHEFLRRFLQHVLPKGLHKVRYYGLWHPSRRAVAARVRQLLMLDPSMPRRAAPAAGDAPSGSPSSHSQPAYRPWRRASARAARPATSRMAAGSIQDTCVDHEHGKAR